MRLWPVKLFPYLPLKQMVGQHREVCALRGKGWGRKHRTVDYVFTYSYRMLFKYHLRVMNELIDRQVMIDHIWIKPQYRGKQIGLVSIEELPNNNNLVYEYNIEPYPEHDEVYMFECIENLRKKGVKVCFKQ